MTLTRLLSAEMSISIMTSDLPYPLESSTAPYLAFLPSLVSEPRMRICILPVASSEALAVPSPALSGAVVMFDCRRKYQ